MKKKFALVTGGSRGIGRAICLRLAADGYSILINYKGNEAAARETLSMIEQFPVEAQLMPFDVSDKAAVDQAVAGWQQANPESHIHVLVNNAGLRRDGLLLAMEAEDWSDVLRTHLDGLYYVTRAALKPMVFARDGRIINIVSLSGLHGMAGQFNYSAAKAGMIGATKALALEVAKRNVTVNAIAPGFIATDMTADLDEAALSKQVPAQRFGKPEDVAALAGFLASPAARYITGQVIAVSGGL